MTVQSMPSLMVALLAGTALAGTLLVPPAYGQGVDRLVIATDPPAVDTNLFWATSADVTIFPALGRLVGNDPITGEYDDSGLAKSWEANEDFSVWTFHLHEGVPWHFDWGELTAEDVVHSYELQAGDDSIQTGVAQLQGAEVEALDDHTVQFTFDGPRIGFLFSVASRGSMVIYSKAQYDEEGIEGYQRQPAGTEHYRYVERLPGDRLVFERVEDHWSGQDATFGELEFRWAPEPATKLALLLAGEAHIADLARELQPDALAGGMEIIGSLNPSVQVTGMFNGLYMQTDDPAYNPDVPWSDIRVREAMNRALNREE